MRVASVAKENAWGTSRCGSSIAQAHAFRHETKKKKRTPPPPNLTKPSAIQVLATLQGPTKTGAQAILCNPLSLDCLTDNFPYVLSNLLYFFWFCFVGT